MHIPVRNQGNFQRTGLTVQSACMLRHVGALVLTAIVVNGAPGRAA